MSCTETISASQQTVHSLRLYNKYESAISLASRIFKSLNNDASAYQSLLQLQQLLGQYTSRNLTYDDDSLEAFLGVLQHYEKKHSLRHIWGTPFYLVNKMEDDPFFVRSGRDSKRDGFLAASLC